MQSCLAGIQYAPAVEYFARGLQFGGLLLEQHEHYGKRTWRNKTAINGPDRPLLLTIPLVRGKHEQQPIREVRIADHEPWLHHHRQSIRTAYGKAPYFGDVMSEWESLSAAHTGWLWDFLLAQLTWSIDLLRLPISIALTESFLPPGSGLPNDFRKGIPAGEASLPDHLIPAYPQVQRMDKPFQPNLSILDVFFHLGPMAGDYVRRYTQHLTI